MQSFKYEKLNVIDDRLVQHEPVVKMYRGSEQSSNLTASPLGGSTVNQSQIQFNINCTPSNYFDRRPMLKTTWSIGVTLTNGTAGAIAAATVLSVPGTDVTMAAYPASNLFGMCDVSINGNQVCTYDMGKYASVITKLSNVSKNMIKSTCPSYPELSFAKVDDARFTLSNSQGNFNDSTIDTIGNGSWTFDNVTNNEAPVGNLAQNATQEIIYTITSYEPLILPPFIYDLSSDSSEAIFGMTNLMIMLNVNKANAYRCLRVLPASIKGVNYNLSCGAGATVSITQCELLYKTYRAPSIIDFKLPSPVSSFHTYNFYNNFVNAIGQFQALAGGAIVSKVVDINMTNIVSTGMPSLILLWCDKPQNLYTSSQAKYYYPITKLSMDLGTNQSLLSNYSFEDLYRLSVDSGLEQSYLSYKALAYTIGYDNTGAIVGGGVTAKQLVGGPVVLRPGISFPLPAEVCTSSSGSFTWRFTCDCVTSNAEDITAVQKPNFNVMMIYDTWVSIDTSTLACSVNKSMLTVPEVLGMSKSESLTIGDIRDESGGALQSHDVVKSGGGFKASGKLASRVRK